MEESLLKAHIAGSIQYYQKKTEWRHEELTDKELSKKSGVSLSTIIRLKDVNSPFLPRISTIIKVAKALGVDYKNLLCFYGGFR